MGAMDTTTMLPVALLLFRSEELDDDRRRRALAALESWLVRRAIRRMTAKNYNRTLTSLLKEIKSDIGHADEAVVRELRSSQATTAVWPSDAAIRERLENGDLYNYVGQPRVRMLLEACELDLRDPAKTEAIALPAGLSIEHAMPQDWEDNWPLPDDATDEQINDRWAHINRLGNLTLVTQPLNSRFRMRRGSPLRLASTASATNSKFAASCSSISVSASTRNGTGRSSISGTELTDRILRVWPGPDSDVWPDVGAD